MVIVTGFRPYSPATKITGNPSEIVARAIGERYGSNTHVCILNADSTCLGVVESLGVLPGVTGVLMLGANIQASPITLELEGVVKGDGLMGSLKSKIKSTGANSLVDYANSIGVPTATAPATPFVYWCLRSYATALQWAEPRKIPCVFMHLNTLRFSSVDHIDTVSMFLEKIRNASRWK